MSALVVSAAYDQARQPHLREVLSRMAEEAQKLTWPIERLHALRDERLRDLVRHAKANSPWHAERLRDVDPDGLTGDDIRHLPVMTKADVMANWDDIVTDRRLTMAIAQEHLNWVTDNGPAYLFDEYHIVTTGGSSGLTGLFPWDYEGWLQAGLGSWRLMPWVVQNLHLSPPRGAFIGAAHASHMSDAIRATFDMGDNSVKVPVTLPLSQIVDALNEFQPNQMLAYPSILWRLALEQLEGRLNIKPEVMLGGAEPLFPHQRKTIEAAFGAPVIDFYGTSETWMLACSMPGREEMHLGEDLLVAEPVDATGAAVPAGTTSAKLLVTNVINKVFPLIRYEIADEVLFLADENPGPWTGRRIAPVSGRHDDVFEYGETATGEQIYVHPYVFWTPLWDSRIAQYQVRQTRTGADVSVELRTDCDLRPIRDALVTAMLEAGHPDPVVTITVEDIPRHPVSGKIKNFVALKKRK